MFLILVSRSSVGSLLETDSLIYALKESCKVADF